MKKIVIIITGIIVTLNLGAQNILNHNETNNIIHLRYGLEPTTVIAAGYTRILSVEKINRQIALFGVFISGIFFSSSAAAFIKSFGYTSNTAIFHLL